MGKSFTSKPRAQESAIDFELDGVAYHFLPGKRSGALINLMEATGGPDHAKALMDWLGAGLNRYDRQLARQRGDAVDPVDERTGLGPQAAHLLARLKDPDSDLELDTCLEICNYLLSEQAARPTGSPSDWSAPPSVPGPASTAGPSAAAFGLGN